MPSSWYKSSSSVFGNFKKNLQIILCVLFANMSLKKEIIGSKIFRWHYHYLARQVGFLAISPKQLVSGPVFFDDRRGSGRCSVRNSGPCIRLSETLRGLNRLSDFRKFIRSSYRCVVIAVKTSAVWILIRVSTFCQVEAGETSFL